MTRETKLLVPLLVFLASSVAAPASDASVSVALTVDDVARAAVLVARVVPKEQSSSWEDGRIVTTTRLGVESVLAGAGVAGSEVRVRTLGGIVGDVGQRVEGEPRFTAGAPSIVFLAKDVHGRRDAGARFVVAGRAQGQLVVARDGSGRDLVRVVGTGGLVERRQRVPLTPSATAPLVTTLDGRSADDATREVVLAWRRTHAR